MPKQALGPCFYIFPTATSVSKAIIDCHGMRPPNKAYFNLPGNFSVHFYVDRRAFLMSGRAHYSASGNIPAHNFLWHVNEIAHGNINSVENFGGGQSCPDYLVSKDSGGKSSKGRTTNDRVGYDDLVASTEQGTMSGTDMAIVTVRKNYAYSVSLQDVVRQLAAIGYTELHCNFCRGAVTDSLIDLVGLGTKQMPGGGAYTG